MCVEYVKQTPKNLVYFSFSQLFLFFLLIKKIFSSSEMIFSKYYERNSHNCSGQALSFR